ncbi:MAG: dihydroorotate dehydrogenase [Candidatus Woesearchaeota archaeon]
MNISVTLCGHRLKNPTILASGILGMGSSMLREVARNGAGALTLKSSGLLPREGHRNPKVIEWAHGLANCYGLTNPGIDEMLEELRSLQDLNVPIIASIFGADRYEFVQLAEKVSVCNPSIIELNLSCPNTKEHGMIFGLSTKACYDVVSEVKNAAKVPVFAKLTPQAPNIAEVAKACEEAGADGITAINTLGPGMFINIDVAKPMLSYKTGGLSGPAIRPVAVRCVYEIYESVEIPIIGTGGVTTGRDAIELMMAGATAVGIGSAVYYRGINVFQKVSEEINDWLENSGYSSLTDIIGVAHG